MKRASLVLAILFGLSGTAFALNNEDKEVDMAESLVSSGRVYIHLTANMSNKPPCATYWKIIACSLTNDGCAQALQIALAAKVSGKKIDFEVGTTCLGSIAELNRLRID